MPRQTFLTFYAHPDDESFSVGGSMAQYAALGINVALVCATRGEAGEISDPALATPETLSQVREEELRCACQVLNVSDLTFLDYRDSGMAGTPDNENPAAFMNIPAQEVVPRLVGIIRRLQPQVVVTFDPTGGYGHPDHIAIHHHTLAAVDAAANPAQYPEQGQTWQVSRLLYGVLPRSFFQQMRQQMTVGGLDTTEFDAFLESGIGWPDEAIHITVDVRDYVEAKWAALHCHRTQFGPDTFFSNLPEADIKRLISLEYYVQAWPEPEANLHLTDVFAGL